MSFKKSHESQIAKITLLNFAGKSRKIGGLLGNYDKSLEKKREIYSFSPTFRRNWTLSPKKSPKKNRISYKLYEKTPEIENFENESIDKYLKSVLKEYELDEIEKNEQFSIRTQVCEKNVFDRFFGENGAVEEERLENYVKNCNLYN